MNQKLLLSFFHLERKTLQWFRWMERSNAIASWEDFTKGLLIRFGPSPYEDPTGTLTKLQQTTTVEEYQTRFEELTNRTEGLNESFMVSCFMRGLEDDIRLNVQMLRPHNLPDAIGLAGMQEKKVNVQRRQLCFEAEKSSTSLDMAHPKPSTPVIKKLTLMAMKERS